MNKFSLIVFIAMLLLTAFVEAQITELEIEPGKAPNPSVRTIPDGTGWLIEEVTATRHQTSDKLSPQKRTLEVIYFQDKRRKSILFSRDGSEQVAYWVGSYRVGMDAFTGKPVADSDNYYAEEYHLKADQFHRLVWLSPENYKGTATHAGEEYAIYQNESKGRVWEQVWIHAKTLLPAVIEFSNRRVTYTRIPVQSTVLPKEYQDKLDKNIRADKQRRLKYVPR